MNKYEKDVGLFMNNPKGIGLFLIVVFMLGAVIGHNWDKPQINNLAGQYWACMDGCSNMQIQIFGTDIYNNETQHQLHNVCTETCLEQYPFWKPMCMQACEKEGLLDCQGICDAGGTINYNKTLVKKPFICIGDCGNTYSGQTQYLVIS